MIYFCWEKDKDVIDELGCVRFIDIHLFYNAQDSVVLEIRTDWPYNFKNGYLIREEEKFGTFCKLRDITLLQIQDEEYKVLRKEGSIILDKDYFKI